MKIQNNQTFTGVKYQRIPKSIQKTFEDGEQISQFIKSHDVFIKATPKRTFKDPLHKRMPEDSELCTITYGLENLLGSKGKNIERRMQNFFYPNKVNGSLIDINTKYTVKDGVERITARDLNRLKVDFQWNHLDTINESIKGNRTLLKQAYLTPDIDGNLLIHTKNPNYVRACELHHDILRQDVPQKLVEKYEKQYDKINEALKDEPDLLAQMYLTPNGSGLVFAEISNSRLRMKMISALQNQPNVLAQIYSRPSNFDGAPFIRSIKNPDEYNLLKSVLKNSPQGRKLI